jgi:hypothetical protein
MASVNKVQVALSAAVVGAVVFLYIQGKKVLDNRVKGQDPTRDGLDPNWPGGKPINIDNPVDVHDYVPSCQIWDEDLQLFVRATNDATLSDNGQTCFASFTQQDPTTGLFPLMRYVDKTGNITFNVENPIQADPSMFGKCYFQDSDGKAFLQDGFAAPNAAKRLCFAAGDNFTNAGKLFVRQNPTEVSWNPMMTLQDIQDFVAKNPSYQWATPKTGAYVPPPPNTTWCEEKVMGTDQNNEPEMFYIHTQNSSANDSNVNACVGTGGRFVDPKQNSIAYRNPNTGAVIQRGYRDNL